jgi:hypothetical protein
MRSPTLHVVVHQGSIEGMADDVYYVRSDITGRLHALSLEVARERRVHFGYQVAFTLDSNGTVNCVTGWTGAKGWRQFSGTG